MSEDKPYTEVIETIKKYIEQTPKAACVFLVGEDHNKSVQNACVFMHGYSDALATMIVNLLENNESIMEGVMVGLVVGGLENISLDKQSKH